MNARVNIVHALDGLEKSVADTVKATSEALRVQAGDEAAKHFCTRVIADLSEWYRKTWPEG